MYIENNAGTDDACPTISSPSPDFLLSLGGFLVPTEIGDASSSATLVDFEGAIVSELGEGEGILLAEVDLDRLEDHRAHGIYGPHHRRPELYGPLADPAGQIHPEGVNLPPESAWRPG